MTGRVETGKMSESSEAEGEGVPEGIKDWRRGLLEREESDGEPDSGLFKGGTKR